MKTILILPRFVLKMLDTTVKLKKVFTKFRFVHYLNGPQPKRVML